MVNVGDTVFRRLRLGDSTTQVSYMGKVIYVHPKGRYYRAEFEMPNGKIIEGFAIMPEPRKKVVDERHKRPKLAEFNRNRWKK